VKSSRRLRILGICAHYPPSHGGGYGLQFSLLCEGLAARGHAIRVLTSHQSAEMVANDKDLVSIDRSLFQVLPDLTTRQLVCRTLKNTQIIRSTIRLQRPDVVFCGGMDGIGFNSYHAALGEGVPSFTWLGDTWLGQAWRNLPSFDAWADLASGGRRPGLRRNLKRLIGWYGRQRGLLVGAKPLRFGPVAALSQFVLDDLRQSGAPMPCDARTIPICLHSAFLQAPSQVVGHSGTRMPHLRALFVGRMEPLKGPDVAVRALAAAVGRGADVTLTFAGLMIEEMRSALLSEARRLGVSDRVSFAGTPATSQLVNLYRSHDVFLFPSRIVEGLGVVNCEAIACGLPVIGTANSGAAEVIIPGKTGFRVKIDDADSMGRHLADLHFDRALLEQLSLSAPRFARRYLPNEVINEMEKELQRLTHGDETRANGRSEVPVSANIDPMSGFAFDRRVVG
jgi:glycosyltransferase involved in cell wall biosynthesis